MQVTIAHRLYISNARTFRSSYGRQLDLPKTFFLFEKASSKYIESSVHKRLSIESLSFFRLEEEDMYIFIETYRTCKVCGAYYEKITKNMEKISNAPKII